ncbi:MAG TPA: M56 family metallopeptidase [Terracidiphilus sp.]
MHLTAFIHFALQALPDAGKFVPASWLAASQSAAALALTAAWQGAAVALGLALCLRLAPRTSARHRFTLWAAGFSVLVSLQILPILQSLVPARFTLISAAALPAGVPAPAAHPLLQLHINPAWSLVIAAFWLAASLFRSTDLAIHCFHLRKIWKTSIPVEIDAASLPRSVERLSHQSIRICTTRELERPSVIGFFAPRILIPDWLFARLTAGELDQIVLHETEHLRRRDDWTNLLQKLCLVLFPLNPGLAWIERRLCREREMACDDGVIHITHAPRAYAACLASLAERGLQRRADALSLGAWQRRPELVRRVHSILSRKHALSPIAARAVLGALGCVLLAGATALARCPRLVAIVPAGSDAAHPAGMPHARPAFARAPRVTSLPLPRADVSKNEAAEQAEAKPPVARPHRASQRTSVTQVAHRSAADRELASTATPGDRLRAEPTARLSAGESGFMVMTTWESLEPSRSANTQTAAKSSDGNSNVRVSGAASAFAVQHSPRQITVTRMYLQIYSAAGVRQSTWLVVQL